MNDEINSPVQCVNGVFFDVCHILVIRPTLFKVRFSVGVYEYLQQASTSRVTIDDCYMFVALKGMSAETEKKLSLNALLNGWWTLLKGTYFS